MKYIYLNALFLVFVFQTSCGQNQTNLPQDNIKSSREEPYTEPELKEADTSNVAMGQVRNIKQARNGDILISAFLAVYRYDGTSFTNLTSKISLPRFSSFWDVLEDRKGNLWFATRDSGVYLLPSGQTNFQHFTTKQGLASNYGATHLYEDKAGNIWFGGGRYDGKSFRNFTTKEGFPNNNITTIIEDKTGKLWIGTRGDLNVYDGQTFTVIKNKDGKTFTNVWGVVEDKKGNIWFGVNGGIDNGLWRYDGSTFTKVSQRGVYAVIEDKKGNIWTTGEIDPGGGVWGLSRYDAKSLYDKIPTVTEIKSGPPDIYFMALIEANDGSIWFGAAGGVYRYDGKTITDFKGAAGQQ
jgi:ligand-binding sensor domain-containing protein